MFKKWIIRLAGAALSVSLIGAVAVPALAKSTAVTETKDTETSETQLVLGKPITVSTGRGGVFFASPQTSDIMALSPVDMTMLRQPEGVVLWNGGFNIMAEKPQMATGTTAASNTTAATPKDTELRSFTDRGVVFFDLTQGWVMRAFKDKKASIYYLTTGGWKRLDTFELQSSATVTRVGTSFLGEGTYALGIEEPLQP